MSYRETIREVTVEGGRIRGVRGNNPIYTVFKGIPYAAPPVGELRWKAPQPVIPWEGVRVCAEYGDIAPQTIRYEEPLYGREFFQNTDPRSEDCLSLNVWTPAKSPDEKLPVFFWVHGGGYFGGTGTEPEFDGEGFCRRGVILVTINYRLGALGFLAHPELSAESEHGVSGNYGILDQQAALKWTRNNIAAFGGDPDNITIGGQSAGAISIMCLMTSPLSKNDFARAIIQSGASVGTQGMMSRDMDLKDAEAQGVEFMKSFGCNSIQELRKVDAMELVKSQTLAMQGPRFNQITDGWCLMEPFGAAIAAGRHADVQYLVGSTADEGYIAEPGTANFLHGKQILAQGNHDFCRLQQQLGRKPVYAYCFSRQMPGDDSGAFHAGELWYEFETLNRCWRPFTGKDWDLAVTFADYWANYCKTGDPNGDGLPTWIPYTSPTEQVMELGDHVGMIATR